VVLGVTITHLRPARQPQHQRQRIFIATASACVVFVMPYATTLMTSLNRGAPRDDSRKMRGLETKLLQLEPRNPEVRKFLVRVRHSGLSSARDRGCFEKVH